MIKSKELEEIMEIKLSPSIYTEQKYRKHYEFKILLGALKLNKFR